MSEQKSDEARYHYLRTDTNVRVANAPLVPAHYGSWDYEIFDGAGGLSASVIDIARLMAMFSATGDTPCLHLKTMQDMIAAALTATKTYKGPSAHGYHGFDGIDDTTIPGFNIATKSGWVEGAQSYLSFAPGLLGVTMLINTNERVDPQAATWHDDVVAAAVNHQWGNTDLFGNSASTLCQAGPSA